MNAETAPLLARPRRPHPPEPQGLSSSQLSKVPLPFRLRGTVIVRVWWQIILVTIYTAGVVYLDKEVDGITINFSNAIIQILGVVTGLLLVFRTNTAYERYSEARTLWSTLTYSIREFTRCIWFGIYEHNSQAIVEKISAINLLKAFAISTKHYLREEYSPEESDLEELIAHLRYSEMPSSNESYSLQQTVPVVPPDRGSSPVRSSTSRRPTFADIQPTAFIGPTRDPFKARAVGTPTNIPIEISFHLQSFICHCKEKYLNNGQHKCDEATCSQMQNCLSTLVGCLTSFEKVLRTPIPLAYSVHLHHMTWLYLIALPYQIIEGLGWWTILVVALAAFSFVGILEIGGEIENPFGYDANDLPLDDFCQVIRAEIEQTVKSEPVDAKTWIFSSRNRPCGPFSPLNATQLTGLSPDQLHALLSGEGLPVPYIPPGRSQNPEEV